MMAGPVWTWRLCWWICGSSSGCLPTEIEDQIANPQRSRAARPNSLLEAELSPEFRLVAIWLSPK